MKTRHPSAARVPRVTVSRVSDSAAAKRLAVLAAKIRRCTECPLHQSRTLAVPGQGDPRARVIIIGEAPGKDEDLTGQPFVGSAGRYLDHLLAGVQLDRSEFFITNIVKCRPEKNRPPQAEEVSTCTKLYLQNQIALVNPGWLILMGTVAVKALLGVKSVDTVRGRWLELEGRKVLATYHPAVRFYREDLAQRIKEDFALLKRDLETAGPPLRRVTG